ncbi:MAG: M15 family metallopeptidase, partial [Bacteroidota bacterium]
WFWTACQTQAHQTEEETPVLAVQAPTQDTLVPMDTVDKKYLLGLFDPNKDTNFVSMDPLHCAGSARNQKIHKETYAAFIKMYEAAKADGVNLVIKSATRNFFYQRQIWEAKWTGARKVGGQNLSLTIPDPEARARKILRYSSMPGTSRHHWGTDFDLNAFENSYFESGKGLKEFQWLEAHAASFGFCRPYTAKGDRRQTGYEEEKWHWSYMPLSKKYQESYRTLVSKEDIKDFKGSEAAQAFDAIEEYVFGIDPACF